MELDSSLLGSLENMVSVNVPHILDASNVQDLSLHPVLVRTGTGDFYEGVGFRYPGVPVARDGRLGDRLMHTDYTNLAPRLGIAYTPTPEMDVPHRIRRCSTRSNRATHAST